MAVDLRAGIVRILKPDGTTAGTGCVIGDGGLIITCSHVVQCEESQLRGDPKPDYVDLVFHMTKSPGRAKVDDGWWRPASAEDIAILRPMSALPEQVEPLALRGSDGTLGHSFRTFGFPEAKPVEGMWGYGIVGDRTTEAGHPVLQLTRAQEITAGFSGAPVLDTTTGLVMGMVSSIAALDEYGRLAATAFATPAETVQALAPDSISLQPALVRPTAPFLVPYPRNPDFVGREADLAQLHQMLLREEPAGYRPVGLTGMGGIGKTQLAVEYAHAYRDQYPGGIFWLEATRPLLQEFADLAGTLELTDTTVGPEPAAHHTWAYLDARPDALVIFDNVDKASDLSLPIAPGLIAANLGCRILFTTRQRDGRPFERFNVKVLPEVPAVRLLLRARPEVADEHGPEWGTARRICTSLGCLPLALELAAAYLGTYSEVTLEGYWERLRTEGRLPTVDDTDLRPEDLPTRHQAAVEATLRTQWCRLEDEDARLLFRAAGQFGEGSAIPVDHLALVTGITTETRPGHPSPLGRARARLDSLSLVHELAGDRLALHPLVHEFAASLTVPAERPALQSQLEANAVAALLDPVQRRQRAITAGECLHHLQQTPIWSPTTMRRPTLEALSELMVDEGALLADRRRAALLLTRLRWLDGAEDTPLDELSACMELVGRYLDSSDDRRYLVAAITPRLPSGSDSLSLRQRAQLLVYRAINLGFLDEFDRAAADYQEAEGLAQKLDSDGNSQSQDYRLWAARIHLGMGNVASEQSETLIEAGDKDRGQELWEHARKLYLAAAESARVYGQDPVLEVKIQNELSWHYSLLQDWDQVQTAYKCALQMLGSVQDPTAQARSQAHVWETAGFVHWKKGQLLEAETRYDQSLSEYDKAYRLAQQEINLLESTVDDLQTLAIAHFNAGDYVMAMNELPIGPGPQPLTQACDHWQAAVELAGRLELSGLEQRSQKRLEEFCQTKEDE